MARPLPLLLLLLSAVLGAAAPSAFQNGKCGVPNPIENAEIMERSTSTKLRYSCAKNYKRKAGTSSLIVCKQDENTKEFRWTKAQLSCIRDPSRPIPQPETTTEDSRREAETSTPETPKATGVNPSVVSLHPYGSEATSQPAAGPARAPYGTAKPSSGTPAVPPTAATEVGTSSVVSATESQTLPQRGSPQASQAQTSAVPTAGNRSTAVSPTGATVNATPPSNTSVLQKRTDALYGGIVPTILVVLVFIVGAVLWNRCRRQGYFLRQTEVPHEEEMASLGSEGGGGSQNIPSASDLSDTGAGNEGAAILSAHGATSTS